MSLPIRPEERWATSRKLRVLARPATLLARVLVMLPPITLHRVLTLVTIGTGRPEGRKVLEWRNAVNTVSKRCAGHGCLQRSVAVMLLAAAHRKSPEWCTGFRTDPFTAHAWVELDGQPIGEAAAISGYKRVMTIRPKWSKKPTEKSAEKKAK